MALPIEDYAVIGDTHTACLVGRDGSVDWLCLPRFDSPACFAALLGGPENGRWLLGPVETDRVECHREYVDHTSVLETTYTTPTGTVKVLDVMPVADRRADLVRRVVGVQGTVRMRHEWVVRFDYGRVRPWVHRSDNHGHDVISAVAGPDRLLLRGPRLPVPVDGKHADEFDVSAGEQLTFHCTWVPSHADYPPPVELDARLEHTMADSTAWARRCSYQGPYREAVLRSLLTLRLLTHSGTGGIVAAPTTSLPENFGGERNWDYRYCWLRDAALTLEAFLGCGYRKEARLWRDWLLRTVAGDPGDLQIMYGVDGARNLPERELDHLAGYAGSRPVRVGNGAVVQRQGDVLGEVFAALERARDRGIEEDEDSWALQCSLLDGLAETWRAPDHGIWEIRGPAQRFTHSRVMVWVAFDRAVRACEKHDLPGPVDRWRRIRDEVRAEVLAHAYDEQRNTFTQHYDTSDVDASLLVLPAVGFVDGDDPRMLGTLAAIEKDLSLDGLLLRYRTESGVDGLAGGEHPFLACSFWMVTAMAHAGRTEDAHALMRRLLEIPNDVGLMAEEYDPVHGRFAGNFPQALSHLALVGAAVALEEATPDGPAGSTTGTVRPSD